LVASLMNVAEVHFNCKASSIMIANHFISRAIFELSLAEIIHLWSGVQGFGGKRQHAKSATHSTSTSARE